MHDDTIRGTMQAACAGTARLAGTTMLALLLGACGKANDATPVNPATSADASSSRHEKMVEEIATTLQACSYEGQTLTVDPGKFAAQAPTECRDMVDRIMDYTGLPKNFVVAAGPVPNAMATILLDDKRVPRRVIAFNPDFIAQVKAATGGDNWAPVSIMAHEIGHHLSGHTITEGHSRPEIELEADKFSGYVLYKMGAPLADSTKAIMTIGSATDDATHPGRDKRAVAITQGWQEACAQAGAANCSAGMGANQTTTTGPVIPVQVATLPAPAASTIPFKYGRFIVDETGRLDPAQVAAMDKTLYDYAASNGVEVALLLVKDLHGLSPEDYAWAMMRQLRIGKLDVGNGAVIVVAPEQNQAGVAYGPGIAKEMEYTDPKRQLLQWIEGAWAPVCIKQGSCKGWTENLFILPNQIVRNTQSLEWTIRYQGMKPFMDTYLADFEAKSKQPVGTPYDPAKDVAFKRIIRFRGKVVALDTPTGIAVTKPEVLSNAAIVKAGYRAVHLQSDDGYPVVFYVDPKTPGLMPSGELIVGGDYTFVGRVQSPSPLQGQAQHLWALSYEAI